MFLSYKTVLTKEQMISQQIQYHHSLLLNSSINTNNQEYVSHIYDPKINIKFNTDNNNCTIDNKTYQYSSITETYYDFYHLNTI